MANNPPPPGVLCRTDATLISNIVRNDKADRVDEGLDIVVSIAKYKASLLSMCMLLHAHTTAKKDDSSSVEGKRTGL